MPGKVIAVASGKGGVGKTNVAANLACCLAQAGQNTLLLDADFSLSNLDVLLNIHPRFHIGHVLTGQKMLEEIIEPGPCGVDIIAGTSGNERLANLDARQRYRLCQELDRLRLGYDTILLDNGAGIAKSIVEFCLHADQVMVVVTPESTAMTDAYSLIKVLFHNHYTGQVNIVVNMADNLRQGKTVYHRLAAVASQFLNQRVYCAAVLLRDERLRTAVANRRPVVLTHPGTSVSRALSALALRVSQERHPDPHTKPLIKKVANWFS